MKVYQANCIEHGERFIALFKTVETNKNKLKEYGQDIASGWGAECISVKLIKHNNHTYNGKTIDLIYNYDEEEL
tara:strand:+ start:3234 stop:3455 length:222 start_codon:yes stop_codon:yes gene_type:complete